jgi:hypothetical protein
MQITVSVKHVYGNELIYPVSENAKLLAKLTGKKTLTRDALATIKKLGYEVEVQAPGLDG